MDGPAVWGPFLLVSRVPVRSSKQCKKSEVQSGLLVCHEDIFAKVGG